MKHLRQLDRLSRLSGSIHHLLRALPDEDDFRTYLERAEGEDPWDVVNLWAPVVIRGLRERTGGAELSLPAIDSYLREIGVELSRDLSMVGRRRKMTAEAVGMALTTGNVHHAPFTGPSTHL